MLKLIHGECLEEMDKLIDQGAVVDAIITDPPYGSTACKWDSIIPVDEMWLRLKKLIKSNGAIVLFGGEPFSSILRTSNLNDYKYDWCWDKVRGSNFATVKIRPFNSFENIMIFYKKQPTYNPQMLEGKPYAQKQGRVGEAKQTGLHKKDVITVNKGTRYPLSILRFSKESGLHPTQKPIALMEYLIQTYTNKNETILDFTCGSGSTLVAAKNLNRNAYGIELEEQYFDIAKKRIGETK